MPSPCGPYSECREFNGQAVCTCQPNYVGSPPQCRPECSVNTDCPRDLACLCNKCLDPCPGTCGFQAVCNVFNHVPSCTCLDGYWGDPFTSCQLKSPERKIIIAYFYFKFSN